VAAAQEDRRLAGRVSAAASAARADNLGILSERTGRGDGMGMNVAGGVVEVQAQALEYDVSPAEIVAVARSTAGYFGGIVSTVVSEGRAENLDITSERTGRGDGMGMTIAGGAAKVQAQALEYDVSPAEVVKVARGTAGYFSSFASEFRAENLDITSERTGRRAGMGMTMAGGVAKVQAQALEYEVFPAEVVQAARGTANYLGGIATAAKNMHAVTGATAQLIRGQPNANTGAAQLNNPDAVRLSEEIGLSVMGKVSCERYTTTSPKAMLKPQKPLPRLVSNQVVTARPSRAGWEFHHATRSGPTWTLEDNITFTMPGHSAENPAWYVESMREAISETYHIL